MKETFDVKSQEVFESLSFEGIEKINKISEVKEFEAGDIIYEPYQPTENLYILLEGLVALRLTAGEEAFGAGIIKVGKGELMGAGALLGSPQYSRQAYCIKKSKVLAINGKKLLTILEEDKMAGFDVILKLARAYFERYNYLTNKLQSIFT